MGYRGSPWHSFGFVWSAMMAPIQYRQMGRAAMPQFEPGFLRVVLQADYVRGDQSAKAVDYDDGSQFRIGGRGRIRGCHHCRLRLLL